MPDRRTHRGAHPSDAADFSVDRLPQLRQATLDLSWLLTRGYSAKRSLLFVGDKFQLRERQRKAVGRSAASVKAVASRRRRLLESRAARGEELRIDGYNVLLTVEAALAGGVVLEGVDGCYRDMAAMSSHYKRVDETTRALEAIGTHLESHGCAPVLWYLDRPISNSGRLKGLMTSMAEDNEWSWQVELVASPDAELKAFEGVIATADSAILDAGGPWLNLSREVVDEVVDEPWMVDLAVPLDFSSSS